MTVLLFKTPLVHDAEQGRTCMKKARQKTSVGLSRRLHFPDAENASPGPPGPFRVDGSCAVHPARPASCRQFNVFTTTCAPGKDPDYTRRNDVLVPIVDYTDRAFAAVMPFFQMEKERDIAKAVNLIRSRIMNLQGYDGRDSWWRWD
jgi:hypothetical protein